jgi:hypothetical protein
MEFLRFFFVFSIKVILRREEEEEEKEGKAAEG